MRGKGIGNATQNTGANVCNVIFLLFACSQHRVSVVASEGESRLFVQPRFRPLKFTRSATSAGAELSSRLIKLIGGLPSDRPLPATRTLGDRLGVANTTVYRLLQELTLAGELWQHPTSGRYYPAAARVIFDRPKPVGCLTRRLELASEQYREILEGISARCGTLHRAMLLWHDDLLVNHPVTQESPVFATPQEQPLILASFLDRHGGATGGFILDHVWIDDALRAFGERLQPAVVLFRSCELPNFANVRANFRLGSLMALAHLLGRGYERIVPILPFEGDPAVDEFFAALEAGAVEAGSRHRLDRLARATNNGERDALIESLRGESRRTALVCPEDNVALFLASALKATGLACPDRIGLLSAMGTDFATRAGITHLRHDFRAMGRLAVEALTSDTPVRHVLEPQLIHGTTT
jgi:DNA-binding transcriptional regulator YhcF (GntR family)